MGVGWSESILCTQIFNNHKGRLTAIVASVFTSFAVLGVGSYALNTLSNPTPSAPNSTPYRFREDTPTS